MTLPAIFTPVAIRELEESAFWYDNESPGLGEEFSDLIQKEAQRIAGHPELHSTIHRDLRKKTVERFPYVLIYRIKQRQVRIVAVFHTRRNPEIWKKR